METFIGTMLVFFVVASIIASGYDWVVKRRKLK